MLKSSSPIPVVIPNRGPGHDGAFQSTQSACCENRPEKTFWQNTTTDPVAAYTLVLAVATIGLWIFTWLMWRTTRRAVNDSAATSQRQGEEMQKSIAESKRAADIAEASLVKLQRAFVSVQQFSYLSHLNTATGKIWWSFHTHWENFGASPTKNLRIFTGFYLESVDIPEAFEFDVTRTERPITFLGPKATLGGAEIHIEGDDLVAVQNGTKFLYLWGRADYKDVFDGTSDHVTKFFVRVGLRGDPTIAWDQNSNIVEMIFAGQNRHNCADEDCNQEAYCASLSPSP